MTIDLSQGATVAAAALPQQRIPYQGWLGSWRSVSQDRVTRYHIYDGTNMLYLPINGRWKRRGGTVQKFDTFGASVGLLPAKWTGKCRQLEEFISDSISDGVPTLIGLVTKETTDPAVLDDGLFSNVWVRDQVHSVNYTLGSEYSATTYPAPGSTQLYRFIPLFYNSGDGGLTRGITEFARRFFVSGSRRFTKVQNWWYFPGKDATPSRWSGRGTESGVGPNQVSVPTVAGSGSFDWTPVGAATLLDCVNDASDTTYAHWDSGAGVTSPFQVSFAALTDPGTDNGFQLKLTLRSSTIGVGETMQTNVYSGGINLVKFIDIGFAGNTYGGAAFNVTNTFAVYTINFTAGEAAIFNFATGQPFTLVMSLGGIAAGTFDVSRIELNFPGVIVSANEATRLIPSGPIPPTHAGTMVKGNVASAGSSAVLVPDSDISAGSWITHNPTDGIIYTHLDELTPDDSDYVSFQTALPTPTFEVGLSDPGFTPVSTNVVTLRARSTHTNVSVSDTGMTVYLMEGATIRAQVHTTVPGAFLNTDYQLTPTEITSITDWTNLRIRITATYTSGFDTVKISQAQVTIQAATDQLEGGWKGADRFYRAVAYRFEDDSVWMPSTPRAPNTINTNGYCLFTVDASNPTIAYDKITWSNLPIGPFGTKSRLLLRSLKIDSTAQDNLELDPTDLRIVWEIKDNTTTTYDDFFPDDDALGIDPDQLIIRDDHMMSPRARYLGGGDSRVCHSYGGLNPGAILLAPVGRSADYDLNFDDNTAALYTQNSSYFRIENSAGANTQLTLNKSDGVTNTPIATFLFSTYDTLEKLVDAINATSFAVNGAQWRAQVLPNANPQAATATALLPHIRTIASVVTTINTTSITKASGGLSKVAVGNYVTGTGITAGTYILKIVSDTELTLSANATASGTVSLAFTNGLGDAPTASDTYAGYQRVIANSLPATAYFNNTYLNQFPIERSTVWMTVASPLSSRSAANCFSAKISNRHSPPLESGISMGIAAVDNGFVVPFSKKTAVIRNTRDFGTGLDSDYRLFIVNEGRGCCAWNSVTAGSRVAFLFTPDGWVAADLFNEMLISQKIYIAGSETVGDFSYEAPLSIAGTAADDDTAYLSGHVIRGALWCNYRASGTHPNRQVVYDFSPSRAATGLDGVKRDNGELFGWSVPLVRSITAMIEGRRGDGSHFYGWNEENAGSTGDGRIDELETTETDNGTAISAAINAPWERAGQNSQISVQEFTIEHSSPTGATVLFDFHRSYSNDLYTFTPSTSSTLPVSRDIKQVSLSGRVGTAAVYWSWRQTAGTASEVRAVEMRIKVLPSYK